MKLSFPRVAACGAAVAALLASVLLSSYRASTAPITAAGTTLYVAIGGKDTGSCQSSASPCASIDYAYLQTSSTLPSETIDVGPGTFAADLYVEGGFGNPLVDNVTIQGSSSNTAPATTVDGAFHANRGQITLDDLTVDGQSGDAIEAGYGSEIYVVDSTVTNSNIALTAEAPNGQVLLTDSTISGNAVAADVASVPADLHVAASTIADNGIGLEGAPEPGEVFLAGTILSGNNGRDCAFSGGSTATDGGYNLDDDGTCGFSAADHSESDTNPDLGVLQNNGGPTETQAPTLASPVLNQIPPGTAGLCPGTDQRGVPRPQGGGCDIGAVELEVATIDAITSPDAATATARSPFSFTVTTVGSPVPRITERGPLPRGLGFVDNRNGTATISGTSSRTGVRTLIVTARFGHGASGYVATQTFTLTVA